MTKVSPTVDILGKSIDTYRKWIEYQFTLEMNQKDFDMDHLRPISSFDISNDRELKKVLFGKSHNLSANNFISKMELNTKF